MHINLYSIRYEQSKCDDSATIMQFRYVLRFTVVYCDTHLYWYISKLLYPCVHSL